MAKRKSSKPARQLHDRYFRAAKREGYVARSAYKLLELQERQRLIRPRDRVLDVGCAPGSWLQVASRLVGAEGGVVGIDLQEVRLGSLDLETPNVAVVRGDVTKVPPGDLLALSHDERLAGRLFDAVISDMAPNTTGAGDHFISVRLCDMLLDILPGLLRPGGNFCMKVFEGETFGDLLRRTRGLFREAKPLKPDACRDPSKEIYIWAKGYRGEQAREETPAADLAPKRIDPAPGWGG